MTSCDQAHDAIFDVMILEKLAHKCLDIKAICDVKKTYKDVDNLLYVKNFKKTLSPLVGAVSNAMIERLARNGLTYDMIVDTYFKEGEIALIKLLKGGKNEKRTIIKTKKVLDSILDHLQQISELIINC